MLNPERLKRGSRRSGFTVHDLVYGLDRGLFDDMAGRALVRNYELGANDREDDLMLARRVERSRRREALGMVPPFRQPQLHSRELILSADDGDRYAGIPLKSLCAGILVAGNTGAGKTTFIEQLVIQLAAQVPGIWLTDMYKTRLRHLRPLLKRAGRELVILNPRNVRINLLEASGNPRQFVSYISDLFVRGLGLPPLARTILPRFIHGLYREFGIYNGRTDAWPTVFDLYHAVDSAEDVNPQAKAAILERLRSLLTALTPETAALRRAWSPAELADQCIVFELLGMSERAKVLILSYYLFSLFFHDMSNPGRSGGLRHFICFEDAQRFAHMDGDTSSGDMAPLEEIAGVIRESGRGLCLAVQSMHGFPRGLAANLATRVMGRMGTAQDWSLLGQDMGLTSEQIAWCKLHLCPGRFVGQVASGSWRHPFLINAVRMSIPRTVTDAEAEGSVKALSHLPLVRADEFTGWDPYAPIRVRTEEAGPPATGPQLDEGSVRFLHAVIDHPGLPSSQYPRLAGMGTRRAGKVRRKLVEKGLLREHRVATSSTGRTAIILEPQPEALELLGLPPLDNGPAGGGS